MNVKCFYLCNIICALVFHIIAKYVQYICVICIFNFKQKSFSFKQLQYLLGKIFFYLQLMNISLFLHKNQKCLLV